jgi:sulfur-oxidizing protein SoxX
MMDRLFHTVGLALLALLALLVLIVAAAPGAARAQVASYQIEGDGIPNPLTATPGNAERGKALLVKREQAPCLKCHSFSHKELTGGGTKGPSLDGIGANLTPAQIRLSVVDLSSVTRGTEMPSFHKSGGQGPRLTAQEVEDIVVFLGTLRR